MTKEMFYVYEVNKKDRRDSRENLSHHTAISLYEGSDKGNIKG